MATTLIGIPTNPQTLNRHSAVGKHAGVRYEIAVDQWVGGAYVVAEIRVDGMAPVAIDNDAFATLEEASTAATNLARELIDR